MALHILDMVSFLLSSVPISFLVPSRPSILVTPFFVPSRIPNPPPHFCGSARIHAICVARPCTFRHFVAACAFPAPLMRPFLLAPIGPFRFPYPPPPIHTSWTQPMLGLSPMRSWLGSPLMYGDGGVGGGGAFAHVGGPGDSCSSSFTLLPPSLHQQSQAS